LINPILQTLEVLHNRDGEWTLRTSHRAQASVRAEPFEAIELALGDLWLARDSKCHRGVILAEQKNSNAKLIPNLFTRTRNVKFPAATSSFLIITLCCHGAISYIFLVSHVPPACIFLTIVFSAAAFLADSLTLHLPERPHP
jgi:hypothetical protein